MEGLLRPRLLLLLPTHTYRADEFVDAAKRLGVDLTVASEVPSALEEGHATELLTLELDNPEAAVAATIAFAKRCPISAVIGPDDDTAVLAAILGSELGLVANPVSAVQAVRSKTVEATAAGNVLVQALGRGAISSIAEMRDIVVRSFPLEEYERTHGRLLMEGALP